MKIIGRVAEMERRAAERPRTAFQFWRFLSVLKDHPEALAVECSDENTGIRYGLAKRRCGFCRKLGGTTFSYQAWATWAPADLTAYAKEVKA